MPITLPPPLKIEPILETVFVKEWNTTAQILQSKVVVMLWHYKYYDLDECSKYIEQYMPGLVQQTEAYRKALATGEACGIKSDPCQPYKLLYHDLNAYARNKYGRHFCG